MSIERVERSLVKTRRSLREVCEEFGIDTPSHDELCISQCTQCSTWHYTYKLVEDLDDNLICTYCDDIFGR